LALSWLHLQQGCNPRGCAESFCYRLLWDMGIQVLKRKRNAPSAVPTLMIFKDGKVVDALMGMQDKGVLKKKLESSKVAA